MAHPVTRCRPHVTAAQWRLFFFFLALSPPQRPAAATLPPPLTHSLNPPPRPLCTSLKAVSLSQPVAPFTLLLPTRLCPTLFLGWKISEKKASVDAQVIIFSLRILSLLKKKKWRKGTCTDNWNILKIVPLSKNKNKKFSYSAYCLSFMGVRFCFLYKLLMTSTTFLPRCTETSSCSQSGESGNLKRGFKPWLNITGLFGILTWPYGRWIAQTAIWKSHSSIITAPEKAFFFFF